MRVALAFLAAVCALAAADGPEEFLKEIKPVLAANCAACHNPANPKNRHNFLKAGDPSDVETRRRLWRSVATQLRNRTMPPGDAKISEADRKLVADWIENRLRTSGCTGEPYAGYVGPRRLNRREYRNTVRDLLGVDLAIADLFPEDESGGAGFDTNGDTLYVPPMMLERYMEAAGKIADRVVVSRPLNLVHLSHELKPPSPPPPPGQKPARRLAPGEAVSTTVTVFTDGPYGLRVSAERPKTTPFSVDLKVDGVAVNKLAYNNVDRNGGATARVATANLSRGVHEIALVNGSEPIDLYSLTVDQQPKPPTADQAALHYRLLGIEPGQTPVNRRATVQRMLARIIPLAYRRPAEPGDVERLIALYDRAAERGDPFEEAVKFTLKGLLVSPKFLFRTEELDLRLGVQRLGQYEMASRLSYFLWASMPDSELLALAAAGKLQDDAVLTAQVDRMLDDPRSRAFAGAFIGQWLGTKEIGGRAMPLLTELQHFYTPDVAADLREQPELFFHYILTADRSVLDLIGGDYTFLTNRLVKYYELEGMVDVRGGGFEKVTWPDDRRAGVLGFASVLGMSSHYKQGSPVLRGAWVLDTLLGTPVPPPPPDVPPLEAQKGPKPASMKAMLEKHRAATACAACHNLMDPIGMALENFDWMGRWRDRDVDGSPVDASGSLPSGEKFTGAVELRNVLLSHKDEFLRQLAGKMLGYATGRGQQDGDQCTIRGMVENLERHHYAARGLIRDVVLSAAFRSIQPGVEVSENEGPAKRTQRRLLGTK
ncbi:MAG: DUF1592 domain-containing protein [Bryobacteraceae bacterium]